MSGHAYDVDTGLVTTILERRHPSSAIPEHRTHTTHAFALIAVRGDAPRSAEPSGPATTLRPLTRAHRSLPAPTALRARTLSFGPRRPTTPRPSLPPRPLFLESSGDVARIAAAHSGLSPPADCGPARSPAATESCIHLATQLVGGSPKDTVCADRTFSRCPRRRWCHQAAPSHEIRAKRVRTAGWVAVGSARGAWPHGLADWPGFLPPPTSNRACDFPAHGSPTFFTGWHSASLSPRTVWSWRDDGSVEVDQPEPVR